MPKRCVSVRKPYSAERRKAASELAKAAGYKPPLPKGNEVSMGESVFEVVKQSVTVREVAEIYGIEVGRSGMACCPFHDDRHSSMKVDDPYFHCFGCGATGDVIDFTARLYNLSPKEAAEKLAQDFGLAYDSQAPPRRSYVRQKSEAQSFRRTETMPFVFWRTTSICSASGKRTTHPKHRRNPCTPRFLEAVQKKDYIGYLLDSFLENSPEEQKLWIAEHQSEIAKLERRVNIMADKPTNRERLQEITAGIEQGIKELFESEKYMRYLSVMSKFPPLLRQQHHAHLYAAPGRHPGGRVQQVEKSV